MSARSYLQVGLCALVVGPLVAGCAAKGRVRAGRTATVDEQAKTAPEAETAPEWEPSRPSAPAEVTASEPGPSEPTAREPAAAAPQASEPVPHCSFVCNVALKGRLPPADETRFSSGLTEPAQALRQCRLEGKAPSFTLRFDSGGTLTGFGVDYVAEEDHDDAACVDAVSQRRPPITYPGPATVRCTERCAR